MFSLSAIADLSPLRLPLADLDAAQAAALRTWFVAHVNVLPPKARRRKPQALATDPNIRQLSLLGEYRIMGSGNERDALGVLR